MRGWAGRTSVGVGRRGAAGLRCPPLLSPPTRNPRYRHRRAALEQESDRGRGPSSAAVATGWISRLAVPYRA